MLYDYIAQADAQYPNTVDADTKMRWLDGLEGKLRDQLADRIPEGAETVGVFPYDDIYIEFLKMKIAEKAGDITRYNNYLTQFNSARDELYAYYVRTYTTAAKAGWKHVL